MQSSNRQSYLDWLRIMAILGVLFFHSARPFIPDDPWHIENVEKSNMLLEFNFFLSRFRMPLLFFISGAVAYFMLQRRSSAGFIALRFRRLFIPLVFGMLLIVPIQVYMERLNNGFKGSFIDFYPSIFTTGAYPHGNLSWHHLWFIAYLFVYDVLFAPVFKWCIEHKNKLGFLKALAKGKRIYLLMLPSVLAFTPMVLPFPETNDLINDWCWIIYWLFFLLAGFICMCIPELIASLERNRRFSLSLAVLAILTINYFRWNNMEPHDFFADYKNHAVTYVFISLFPFTAWLWVFTAIGYGKHYLNKTHAVLKYVNSAVYPFYILHQTVIVVLAYYVVKTKDDVLMKFLFIAIASFLLCMAIYHLFIRPFAVTRFLFGAKKDVEQQVKTTQKQPVGQHLPQPA